MLSRFLGRGAPGLLATFLPMDFVDHDKVEKTSNTAQDFYKDKNRRDTETGKDRLYLMFSIEYGIIAFISQTCIQYLFLEFIVNLVECQLKSIPFIKLDSLDCSPVLYMGGLLILG